METQIKFRYRIFDDHTGKIIKVVYGLKDIEKRDFHGLGTILSRDRFTGQNEKNDKEILNNKEIFENDIIEVNTLNGEIENLEVCWDDANGWICSSNEGMEGTLFDLIRCKSGIKIVGNTHDGVKK